ncbi:hypothetical protein SLS54_008107 [Diplodia seriata]
MGLSTDNPRSQPPVQTLIQPDQSAMATQHDEVAKRLGGHNSDQPQPMANVTATYDTDQILQAMNASFGQLRTDIQDRLGQTQTHVDATTDALRRDMETARDEDRDDMQAGRRHLREDMDTFHREAYTIRQRVDIVRGAQLSLVIKLWEDKTDRFKEQTMQ